MTKGERIIKLREKRGLSQVELADSIGVSKQTMYKYENDIITNIPSDKIELMAQSLRSTPSYIMGWEDEEGSVTFGEDIDRQTKKSTVEEAFNLLNPDHQKAVLDLMQTLLAAEKR